MKRWLKHGLIGLIIGIILNVILFSGIFDCIWNPARASMTVGNMLTCNTALLILFYPLIVLSFLIIAVLSKLNLENNRYVLEIVSSLIISFLFIIVGFIVNRFKEHKK